MADQILMDKFIPKEPKKQFNLSDLIMEKLQQSGETTMDANGNKKDLVPRGLNEKVVEVYTK